MVHDQRSQRALITLLQPILRSMPFFYVILHTRMSGEKTHNLTIKKNLRVNTQNHL